MADPVTKTVASSLRRRAVNPDPLGKEARKACMRAVKSVNTTPELQVRRILHAAGYRFRLHKKDLPGKPDIYLGKYKTAIFIHGCFWHGHDCPKGLKRPATNAEFWDKKIDGNIKRDALHIAALREKGIKTVIIWECELKKILKQADKTERLLAFLHQDVNGPL